MSRRRWRWDWDRVNMRSAVTPVLCIVLLVAVVVDGVAIAGSRLWIVPTSLEYLDLAVDVAERFDFSNEMFLLRTPGYPLLLAIVFRLCGPASPLVILLLQHAMTAGTALLIALTGWHLTQRRDMALLSGVMCACSLQVLAFANQIMTETPYTFALIASVYFLVKYHRWGVSRDLAFASLAVGSAYLFRPIGLTVVCLLPLVALHRVWSESRKGIAPVSVRRSVLVGLSCAVLPAGALIVPWWLENQVVHGANSFARCYDFALYNRAANVERLGGGANEAFADVHRVVRDAKARGRLAPDADEGMAWTVWQAYREVEGRPLKESSTLLGRAAADTLWHDPLGMIAGTIRYSAWMILTPDSSYRYQPGGAGGVHGRRPDDADIFDSGLYLEPLDSPLRAYANYMPLESGPKDGTPRWTAIARWFYRHVEKGPAILGIGDSLYEELTLLFLLAGVFSLCTPNRAAWLIVLAVVALQIVPSAFVAGVGPRYSVPIQPLMKLFGALFVVSVLRALRHAVRVLLKSGIGRRNGAVGLTDGLAAGSA